MLYRSCFQIGYEPWPCVSFGQSCTWRNVAHPKNSSESTQLAKPGRSPFVSSKLFSNSGLLRPMWDLDLTHKKFAFGNCVSSEKNDVVYSACKIRWHFVILSEWICTDIYLLRFLRVYDTIFIKHRWYFLRHGIYSVERTLAPWGLWKFSNTFLKTCRKHAGFSQHCRIGFILFYVGFRGVFPIPLLCL